MINTKRRGHNQRVAVLSLTEAGRIADLLHEVSEFLDYVPDDDRARRLSRRCSLAGRRIGLAGRATVNTAEIERITA